MPSDGNKEHLIKARLVSDGGPVLIPPEMGTPRDDQMQGTDDENLAELAGRVCYDSLGTGRPTDEYHKHLLSVRHLSVYRHRPYTFSVHIKNEKNVVPFLIIMANRPGVRVVQEWEREHGFRVTMNVCAVLEWYEHDVSARTDRRWMRRFSDELRAAFRSIIELRMPCLGTDGTPYDGCVAALLAEHKTEVIPSPPQTPDECWVSLFLAGSRGMSHEQVRHHFDCAVSQRSTRYVDEHTSPWVTHPLEEVFGTPTFTYEDASTQDPEGRNFLGTGQSVARREYRERVEVFERGLINQGIGKATARKQARGAGRGMLGNALYTEMIFSASVRQWRRMLLSRASVAADAEIRQLYAGLSPEDDYPCVLNALCRSKYADYFAGLVRKASPDGIGCTVEAPSWP